MIYRIKLLGAFLSATCLALGIWSSHIAINEARDFVHDEELQTISESLDRYAQSLPSGAPEARFISGAVHNLMAAREGSILVDHNSLLGFCLLAFVALGLALLLTIAPQEKASAAPSRNWFFPRANSNKTSLDSYRHDLQQTADELHQVYLDLGQKDPIATQDDNNSVLQTNAQFDQIIQLESHLACVKTEILQTMGNVRDIADHLQKLSSQCEDNAHFTAATRLEWNAMGTKIRQMTESHNKLKSTSEKMTKQQQGCHELISKSLGFNQRHDKHAESARDHVFRMNEISKETLSTLDTLAISMAESNQDVGSASTLVRGLSERAEEIVNIIDIIDDIAEQTNQLALNASIEAARAGEQGQGFAVVAGEVRSLAARSSTATKSITDLLGTIQQEADHASVCLEKSRKSVEIAHFKMLEVDHSYREAVTISRQALSELNHIISTSSEHLQELKYIEKQSHEIKKYFHSIHSQIEEQGRLNRASYSECNQLTNHSDRFSRLMQRQYFEITHCDRMVEGSFYSLDHIKSQVEEGLSCSNKLRKDFQNTYESNLRGQVTKPGNGVRVTRALATLHAASRYLEVIASPLDAPHPETKEINQSLTENYGKQNPPNEMQDGDVLIGERSEQQKVS